MAGVGPRWYPKFSHNCIAQTNRQICWYIPTARLGDAGVGNRILYSQPVHNLIHTVPIFKTVNWNRARIYSLKIIDITECSTYCGKSRCHFNSHGQNHPNRMFFIFSRSQDEGHFVRNSLKEKYIARVWKVLAKEGYECFPSNNYDLPLVVAEIPELFQNT